MDDDFVRVFYSNTVHGRGKERQMREKFSREQRISIYLPIERVTTPGF